MFYIKPFTKVPLRIPKYKYIAMKISPFIEKDWQTKSKMPYRHFDQIGSKRVWKNHNRCQQQIVKKRVHLMRKIFRIYILLLSTMKSLFSNDICKLFLLLFLFL